MYHNNHDIDRRTVLKTSGVLAAAGTGLGGGLITDGRSVATVGITVTGAELTASIGGSGEVIFQESDDDPTPTPP